MHTIATRCRHLWKPALLAAAFGLVLPVSSTAAQQQNDDGRSQLRPGFEMPSQYLVTVTVYETWPAHPKLNFDVGQRRADAKPVKPRGPRDHRMSHGEHQKWLANAADKDVKIIASPRLLVNVGEPATIRVGTNDDQGNPIDGCEVNITVKQSKRHIVGLDMSYHEYGLDVRRPASDFADGDQIHVHDLRTFMDIGSTQFALATGYIGAPMRLVGVTINSLTGDEHAGGVDDGDRFPKVEYYAVVWEFDDTEPNLSEVLADEHIVLPPHHGRAQHIRRFPTIWMLPEGDTDRALTRWLRDHGNSTSIGGKAGAAVGDDEHHAELEAPRGSYNRSDVPPYEIWFDSTIAGEGEKQHPRTKLLVTNTDPAINERERETWRSEALQFTPSSMAVVLIPQTKQNPWRVMLVRARCIDSWDEIPKQTAVGVIKEGKSRLPAPPPPVKPPKDDDTSQKRDR